MNEILTARLNESYTHMETGVLIQRIRLVQFVVVPTGECLHLGGTICIECATGWQCDYIFDDPFPFARIDRRPTISDLITTGKLEAGDPLILLDTSGVSAVATHDGLMLADGRVYANPGAAANALQDEVEEPPHDEQPETETCPMPDLGDVQQLNIPATSLAADHVIVIAITAYDRRHAAARAITWIQDHTPAVQDWHALPLDRIGPRRWTVALIAPEDTALGASARTAGDHG
ncbi:hypothetical protein [Nocardia sp. CS682]|uniref:hypothetical protein n=1 Tax=Nocardia sp. CS682 TaxID=1047172 RepID=UPI0010753EF5|nr:hypothetical protein [Nocardia sp. CS682]